MAAKKGTISHLVKTYSKGGPLWSRDLLNSYEYIFNSNNPIAHPNVGISEIEDLTKIIAFDELFIGHSTQSYTNVKSLPPAINIATGKRACLNVFN